MTHYAAYIILPLPVPDDIFGTVSTLLAPYDELIKTPPRRERCPCVGALARQEVETLADHRFGTMILMSIEFQKLPHIAELGVEDGPTKDKLWKEYCAERNAFVGERLGRRRDVDAPDPACPACHGKGERTLTSNPQGKYDYYEIGGDWVDGEGKAIMEVKFIDPEEPPSVIVTPDGVWHTEGDIGIFATLSEINLDWPEEARQLLTEYYNHTAVVIDCHT